METTIIWGLYRGYIGVIMGSYWDKKEMETNVLKFLCESSPNAVVWSPENLRGT